MFLLNFNHSCSYLIVVFIYFFRRVLIFFNFASVSSLKCIDSSFTSFGMSCEGNGDSSPMVLCCLVVVGVSGIGCLAVCSPVQVPFTDGVGLVVDNRLDVLFLRQIDEDFNCRSFVLYIERFSSFLSEFSRGENESLILGFCGLSST